CLVEPGLLALHDPCVTREEAGPLERGAKLGVGFDERAGDAVTNGPRLPAGPTTVDAHAEVEGPLHTGHLKRRKQSRAVCGAREVLLDRAAVEPGHAVAGLEDHSCDGRLSLPRSSVLRNLAHDFSSHFSGCGACGPCGCAGPA